MTRRLNSLKKLALIIKIETTVIKNDNKNLSRKPRLYVIVLRFKQTGIAVPLAPRKALRSEGAGVMAGGWG